MYFTQWKILLQIKQTQKNTNIKNTNTKTHKHTNTKTHKHTNTKTQQTHKHKNTQTQKHTNTKTHKHKNNIKIKTYIVIISVFSLMSDFTNNIFSLFDTSIKMSMLNSINSNNGIFGSVFAMIFIAFTSHVIKMFQDNISSKDGLSFSFLYYKHPFWYYLKKRNIIEYTGKTTMLKNAYQESMTVSNAFSDKFKALWKHISSTAIANKTSSIYKIKEYYSFSSIKKQNETDSIYVVSQIESFIIDEKLQIYAYTSIQNEENEDEQKKSSKTEKIVITLYSYVCSLHDLREFVDNITEKYLVSLENNRYKKKFIYSLVKTKFEDNSYECWQESMFESNRSFDNVYFDGKSNFISKIDFFLNNKQWYQEKGIPYTLGIGLHGPPGTGKTSLIKAVSNYTNRHIVIISSYTPPAKTRGWRSI